ncbi:MAG: hypothetical protein AB7F99_13610 [Vicinamibacterales bacterium]
MRLIAIPTAAAALSVATVAVAADTSNPAPRATVSRLSLAPAGLLRISDVQVEATVVPQQQPASRLTFTVVNDSDVPMGDVSIEIAFLERLPTADRASLNPRIVVGPFVVHMDATLKSGFSANYELVLRNLTEDCACEPRVLVISGRPWVSTEP